MNYAVGFVLALLVAAFGRVAGFDRDRAFYATVLVVVASYYVLFAAVGGTPSAVALESIAMAAFVILAVVGFRGRTGLVAAGLVAHGLFDAVHGRLIANAGVPASWPGFCLAFDVTAGALLAWLAARPRHAA